jgi:hypothetical protein
MKTLTRYSIVLYFGNLIKIFAQGWFKNMASVKPMNKSHNSQAVYNSFYVHTPLTDEQKSRFLKYWGISKPNQKSDQSLPLNVNTKNND